MNKNNEELNRTPSKRSNTKKLGRKIRKQKNSRPCESNKRNSHIDCESSTPQVMQQEISDESMEDEVFQRQLQNQNNQIRDKLGEEEIDKQFSNLKETKEVQP